MMSELEAWKQAYERARANYARAAAENKQLRARIRELEAIAAGAVVNAAERAVDLMALQRFNEGAGVDL